MRGVLIEVSETYLAERERLGLNRFDERWEGEWHFVNPAKWWHARSNLALSQVLAPLADSRWLIPVGDGLGVFRADDDWRIPDQAYVRPEDTTERGVDRADLVVEFRSPGDESYAKLPFYAAVGVREVLIMQRDRTVELFRRRGDGELVLVDNAGGQVLSQVLGCSFETVEGPLLRVTWDGGSAGV